MPPLHGGQHVQGVKDDDAHIVAGSGGKGDACDGLAVVGCQEFGSRPLHLLRQFRNRMMPARDPVDEFGAVEPVVGIVPDDAEKRADSRQVSLPCSADEHRVIQSRASP